MTPELTPRKFINNFLNEKLETGICTRDEWEKFCKIYEQEHGYIPKLYGDDIKIIEVPKIDESSDKLTLTNKVGDIAYIQEQKKDRAREWITTVYSKDNVLRYSNIYPTLKGARIAIGRLFGNFTEVKSA